MGYYVKPLPKRKSTPNWKIQYISWKKADTKASKAIKPKKETDIPRNRWSVLGFHKGLTFEEAKARAKQLNAQVSFKRQEEKKKEFLYSKNKRPHKGYWHNQ